MHETLRQWRTSAGLTQAELADRLGVDQSFVSSYETGRRRPGVDLLFRWAEGAGGQVAIEFEPSPPAKRADHDQALTMTGLAEALVASAPTDWPRRMRLVLEFSRGYGEADPFSRHELVEHRPTTVGGPWDALLGGLAEHYTFHDARDAPEWVYEPHRFLDHAWYFVDRPRLRQFQRLNAPAACARRLVFIDRHDLEHV